MKKTKKIINVMEPDLSVKEKSMLLKTFKRGEISTFGEATNILNKKLKKLCGFRYCFSTTSGSTGLFLAFKAIGLTNNDLVIAPSYTFIATISSIRSAGGHPWLFDIQKSNLTLDLDQVERTLKNKIMGSLEDKLPDVMGDKIPNFTGPSVQLPEPPKVNKLGNPKN